MIINIIRKVISIFFVILFGCSSNINDQKLVEEINNKYNTKLAYKSNEQGNVYSITLSSHFDTIPNEIQGFNNLEYLFMNWLNNKTVPQWIKNFDRLKKITFINVPLQSFPIQVLELDSLEHIGFKGNNIEYLPDSICLENFSSLFLSNMKVRNLPLLKNNQKPKFLFISKTDISEIPTEYSTYEISKISIEDNRKLDHMDNLFGTYDSLKEVNIGYRGHTKFPMESFKKCYNLEVLSLSDQGLFEFPDFIYQNTKLQRLYIGKNPFKIIKTDIIKLKDLEHLDLDNCVRIRELPEEIFALPKLKSLHIKTTLINKLPSGIMGLPKREVPMKIYVSNALESYVPLGMSLVELNDKGYILKN
ncbi:leucine-rich repeat domain-containing protein [Flammeovirga aprica]|uniref:Leucine-rich repeat domain-containing protein n=1 Tax=Flammeovirga aprica JL-4 TaxID=694437 RepID=A0A7X9NZP9_9BACT|nr:leucine-rich repeat domain-containing protein [Flammeovirga aprica]NME66760.1 leucine-rich repeat domain-containing protein [Flammeovirga aprica JL-4]